MRGFFFSVCLLLILCQVYCYDVGRIGPMGKEVLQRLRNKKNFEKVTKSNSIDAKRYLLEKIAQVGRIPRTTLKDNEIVEACLELHSSPTLEAIDGAWRVVCSTVPFPRNIGPIKIEAKQNVDFQSRSCQNELNFIGLRVSFPAIFDTISDSSLLVEFTSLQLGPKIFTLHFPTAVQSTWYHTYTDPDLRIVRVMLNRDTFSFPFLEKSYNSSSFLVLTRDRGSARTIKRALLNAIQEEDEQNIRMLIDALAVTAPPSPKQIHKLLPGSFKVLWTTEAELLALTKLKACRGAFQTISTSTYEIKTNRVLSLNNLVDFGDSGFLSVSSSCEPGGEQIEQGKVPLYSRIFFRFKACRAKLWFGPELDLPPLGAGFFDVIYIDEDIRVSRDSRGDLQILQRRRLLDERQKEY